MIIVDDGYIVDSYDIVLSCVNKSKEEVKVLSQSNKGAASARNRVLEETIGEYIMFMDCDDLISPHKILKQVEILQENVRIL